MKKFIPEKKLGKKARRKLHLKKRRTFGPINPVTRKPKNPRAYVRRKRVQEKDDTLLS